MLVIQYCVKINIMFMPFLGPLNAFLSVKVAVVARENALPPMSAPVILALLGRSAVSPAATDTVIASLMAAQGAWLAWSVSTTHRLVNVP